MISKTFRQPWGIQALGITVILSCAAAYNISAHPGDVPMDGPSPFENERQEASQNADATPRVSITIEGVYRVIRSNGMPNHQTGQFPNRGNPNRIAPQNYEFRVPVHPQVAAQITPLGMGRFGIAV